MVHLRNASFLLACFILVVECVAGRYFGVLKTPRYPVNYPTNLTLLWNITAPRTSKGLIQLCFRDFQTDLDDYLTVYDVQSRNVATVLYRFSVNGPRVRCLPTQSRNVNVTFRSRTLSIIRFHERRGFYFAYSLMPNNDTGIPSPLGGLTYNDLPGVGYTDVVAPSNIDGFIYFYVYPLKEYFSELVIVDAQTSSFPFKQLVNLDKTKSYPKYIYTRARHVRLQARHRNFGPPNSRPVSTIILPWALYSPMVGTMVIPHSAELSFMFGVNKMHLRGVRMYEVPFNEAEPSFEFYSHTGRRRRYTEKIVQTAHRFSSISGCMRVAFYFQRVARGPGGLQLVYQSTSLPTLWQAAWQSRGNEKASVTIFSHDVLIAFRRTWGGHYRVSNVSISDCGHFFETTTFDTTSKGRLPIGAVHSSYTRIVSSPGFPSRYPPYTAVKWRIISDRPVSLFFRHFETEEKNDTFQVYDKRRHMRTFSGRVDPGYRTEVIAKSGVIELRFSSNSHVERKGFRIVWQLSTSTTTTTTTMPTQLFAKNGVLQSPGYPLYCPPRASRSWIIAEHADIFLLFEEFELEEGVDEFVVYKEALYTKRDRELSTYSGHVPRGTCFATGSHPVKVVFLSNAWYPRPRVGFRIRYLTTRPSTCERESNIGQIVGITLGVFGFLILSSAIVCVYRRRKRRLSTFGTRSGTTTTSEQYSNEGEPRVSLTDLVTVSGSVHNNAAQGVEGPYMEHYQRGDYVSPAPPIYSAIYPYSIAHSFDPPSYDQVEGISHEDARYKPQDIAEPPPSYNEAVDSEQADNTSRDRTVTNRSSTDTACLFGGDNSPDNSSAALNDQSRGLRGGQAANAYVIYNSTNETLIM